MRSGTHTSLRCSARSSAGSSERVWSSRSAGRNANRKSRDGGQAQTNTRAVGATTAPVPAANGDAGRDYLSSASVPTASGNAASHFVSARAPADGFVRPSSQGVSGGGTLRLHLHKADFTVNSLVDKINRGKLNLQPKFQREYVWSVRTASKLIESLLLNVPGIVDSYRHTSNALFCTCIDSPSFSVC